MDAGAGRTVEPFRIEDEAAQLPTNFVAGSAYRPRAATAALVVAALEGQRP